MEMLPVVDPSSQPLLNQRWICSVWILKPQRRLKVAVAGVALPGGVGGAVEEAASKEVGKTSLQLEPIWNDLPTEAGFDLLADVMTGGATDILDAAARPGVLG